MDVPLFRKQIVQYAIVWMLYWRKKRAWQGRTATGAALMIWMVEKKVFQIVLDLGFERVKIPVRVKLEFKVKEGKLVPDSLTKAMLYNRLFLEKRYPNLDQASLKRSIERKVKTKIQKHLLEHGFIEEEK